MEIFYTQFEKLPIFSSKTHSFKEIAMSNKATPTGTDC